MTPLLNKRAVHLKEQMDDPDCDPDLLFATYRQFSRVNRLIARWRHLFNTRIAPLMMKNAPLKILDVGCGGGDLCLRLSEWAGAMESRIDVMGIDPDPRTIQYTRQLDIPENVAFRRATLSELAEAGDRYDVVLSNHLLHHLSTSEVGRICEDAERVAKKLIIFNDIRRSRTGFFFFGLIAPLFFHSSFIVEDGLTSIRRSYTSSELRRAVRNGWEIETLFPSRLLLIYEPVRRAGSQKRDRADTDEIVLPETSSGGGHG